MNETLLHTKLFAPPLRPNLVPRSRLIDRLNQGILLGHKLILVSAAAGFGKSTLLSAWMQQTKEEMHAAWLSLDSGDNDLVRFVSYFAAALQTVDADIGERILATLQSPGTADITKIQTALLNEIAEFDDDLVLMIDDYHVIESQLVDETVTFLLDHLPANMHLVIASSPTRLCLWDACAAGEN